MPLFDTIKTFILLFAYFAAFQLGTMNERPKAQWPKARAGQSPIMAGDWATYQKIYFGVVGVAVLLTLIGPMGIGGMFGGMGGGMGSGYY